jgi:transcriptional regulator with XRE-family HTH domain
MTNEVVLKNLKRIWNQRKRELGLTQVSAAKDLGWTQGALSQYLNNLTELRPSATIKLANYLSVPASDIDPNIHKSHAQPSQCTCKTQEPVYKNFKAGNDRSYVSSR